MKKSELRKIIKEEIDKSNFGSYWPRSINFTSKFGGKVIVGLYKDTLGFISVDGKETKLDRDEALAIVEALSGIKKIKFNE